MGSLGSRASHAIKSQLPTRKITKSEEEAGKKCMICHEEYCEGQIVKTLPCIHHFHVKCIDPWLAQKDTCPECRHNVGCNEVKQEAENDEDSLQRIQRMVYDNLDDDDDESSSSSEQEEESSSEQEEESVEDVVAAIDEFNRQRLERLSPIPGSPAPGPQDASSIGSSNITYNAEEIESID